MDRRVFCDVVSGRSEASTIPRDARRTAFLDVQPVNEGYALIVPNRHAGSLQNLSDEDGAAVFRVARKVAAALYESGLRCGGVTRRLAAGQVSGQEVPYVHLHAVPRFEGDGVGLVFGPGYEDRPDRNALGDDATSQEIAPTPGTVASAATSRGLWRGRLCAPGSMATERPKRAVLSPASR